MRWEACGGHRVSGQHRPRWDSSKKAWSRLHSRQGARLVGIWGPYVLIICWSLDLGVDRVQHYVLEVGMVVSHVSPPL